MKTLRLELYVMGHSPKSRAALDNLRRVCERRLAGHYDLQVIDVIEQPDAAEAANVVATPALLRRGPPPLVRVVGDLSDRLALLHALGLDPEERERNGTDG